MMKKNGDVPDMRKGRDLRWDYEKKRCLADHSAMLRFALCL